MRVLTLRFKAGDELTARQELNAVLGIYQANRELIVDVERAEVLCRMGGSLSIDGPV